MDAGGDHAGVPGGIDRMGALNAVDQCAGPPE